MKFQDCGTPRAVVEIPKIEDASYQSGQFSMFNFIRRRELKEPRAELC